MLQREMGSCVYCPVTRGNLWMMLVLHGVQEPTQWQLHATLHVYSFSFSLGRITSSETCYREVIRWSLLTTIQVNVPMDSFQRDHNLLYFIYFMLIYIFLVATWEQHYHDDAFAARREFSKMYPFISLL